MIRINKPRQAPEILRTRGSRKRTTHCRSYTQHESDYDSGQRTFAFDATIYGHASVKRALIEAQHSKCCFCESKVGEDGDVEHFRPKAACCQQKSTPLLRPGYYWLAYDWDNLLLCCSACNQRHKRNYFPLANPQVRARSHLDDIEIEDPLFINPAQHDPQAYISFRQEIPYAIGDNPRGKATIENLGLGREILNERRRDRLAMLSCLQQLIDLAASGSIDSHLPEIRNAQSVMAHALDDDAEFAAMARAASVNNFYL